MESGQIKDMGTTDESEYAFAPVGEPSPTSINQAIFNHKTIEQLLADALCGKRVMVGDIADPKNTYQSGRFEYTHVRCFPGVISLVQMHKKGLMRAWVDLEAGGGCNVEFDYTTKIQFIL